MFNFVLESLQQFIDDMDADWCMVYDYMEAHCGVLTEEQWDQVEVIYHQNLTDLRYQVTVGRVSTILPKPLHGVPYLLQFKQTASNHA